jgi:hypothetical protein
MADPSDFDASQFLTLYIDDTDSDPPTGWVTFLQQRLQFKGFDPGPIDGIFGPRTEAAVKAAQTWGGATVDGVVGNQTWGVLHDAFGVAGGTNRARPHRGGGGGGGGTHDLSNDRVFFSTTPFYSSTTDRIHFDLVMARGVPIAKGEKLAELTVIGPDGTTDLGENFFAEHDITGTPTLPFQSIVLTVTSPGSRHAKIVLDSGRGDSRTFTFEPNFTASEP